MTVETERAARCHPAPRRAWPRRFLVALGAVVALAALLRLWSITFGVPMVTFPDEPLIRDPAVAMVRNRDLNPHYFVYPGLVIYAEAGVVAGVHVLGHVVHLSAGRATSLEYVLGRLLMAGFSIATVGLVGITGYRLAARRRSLAGLAAAGMLAVSFLHVKDSHYLKADIPTAFFAALTLWFTLDVLEHNRTRDWLLAAVSVGLAAAAKYTGIGVALVPAIALLTMPGGARRWRIRWRTVVLMVAVAAAVFLALNPGLLLTPRDFWQQAIVYNQTHWSTGHPGAEGNDSWLWYLKMLWSTGIGPTLAPLVIVGLCFEARRSLRRERVAWLLLLFPVLYYLDTSRYVVRFDRQLMPILPYLALIGARWLDAVPVPRIPRLASPARVGLLLLALLAFVVPAVKAARWDIETGKTDTRYAALAWVEANIPKGTVVAREWYTPTLADAGYHDLYIRSVYDQPVAWYDANHVEYLLVASFMYQRYLDAPTQYPEQAAFYRNLLEAPALARFDPGGRYTGPVIFVFRMADVHARLNTHAVPPPPG